MYKTGFIIEQKLFERQRNLMYLLGTNQEAETEGQVAGGFWGKKSSIPTKTYHSNHPNNLLVFDIPKQQEKWIFEKGDLLEGEYIKGILYEHYFIPAFKSFKIEGFGIEVVNNFELTERAPINYLLLETWSPSEELAKIWLIDKWGFSKKKLAHLPKPSDWHLDVYNMQLRLFENLKEGLSIRHLDW